MRILLITLLCFFLARAGASQQLESADKWEVYYNPKKIPKSIIKDLDSRRAFEGHVKIQKSDKPIRVTDVVDKKNKRYLTRQLILSAETADYYLLAYRHTVFQLHAHAILFKKTGDNYELLKSIYVNKQINELDKILNEVTTKENVPTNEY